MALSEDNDVVEAIESDRPDRQMEHSLGYGFQLRWHTVAAVSAACSNPRAPCPRASNIVMPCFPLKRSAAYSPGLPTCRSGNSSSGPIAASGVSYPTAGNTTFPELGCRRPRIFRLHCCAARFAHINADELQHVLVTEYPAGAAIGWHKDKRVFGDVIGISLLSACVFRFRRKSGATWKRASFVAEPRSAYLLRGPAREQWEHSIPPVDALRYSITFRGFRPDCASASASSPGFGPG
jgi:hypothetical protein